MHVSQPCSVRWSSMTSDHSHHKFCGSCEKTVFDFTKSTQEEFDLVRQKEGPHLCGRFNADENGNIYFPNKRPKQRWQKVFLLALLLNFHQTMFSNVNMDYLQELKSRLWGINQTAGEKVTLYGVLKNSHGRLGNASVQITVSETISFTTTTDSQGRFTFELPPNMYVDTLVIKINNGYTKNFVLNETALEASKRIYKIKLPTRRFVGCPSF